MAAKHIKQVFLDHPRYGRRLTRAQIEWIRKTEKAIDNGIPQALANGFGKVTVLGFDGKYREVKANN